MHPSCQTLGVTKSMPMNLACRAIAPRPSRPAAQRVSASAGPHVRTMPTLRLRPEECPFVAVAEVVGYSPKQATRPSLSHRTKAFQAQLVPALAHRRRQMSVSLWALPLSSGQRGFQGTAPRGSGFGSIQVATRSPTSLTPNPSIKRTVKGLRPSPAAYVKR